MFGTEVLPSPRELGDAWVAARTGRVWKRPGWPLTEEHLAARLELGAAGELVGELESLVASTRCANGCGGC